MKLEFKHIVGYLPWESKVFLPADELVIYLEDFIFDKEYYTNETDLRFIKIILRPLSDLTKEIEVNGEKFIPIHWLDENIKPTKHKSPSIVFTDGYVEMEFLREIEKLYEWHFDIHGLIEAGLAIDKNTLS